MTTLFDQIPTNGTETSALAAQSMRKSVDSCRQRVLLCIRTYWESGCTCDDVEKLTGMRHQNVSARINALAKEGAIVSDGEKRATRSGGLAIVWRAAK